MRRLIAAAIGFALVVLWSFLQTASFMPEGWHHPIWQEAASLVGPVRGAISVDKDGYGEALVRLLSYGGFFVLALAGTREKAAAALFVRALAGAGLLYAFYGLLAQSTGSDTILWYKKWAYQGFLTSTFVNKNSYAAYAGIGLLAVLAMARAHLKKVPIKDAVLARRSYAVAWFESLGVEDYLYLLAPFVMLGALVLTGSRAGIFASFLGVFAFLVSLALARRKSLRAGLGLGAAALAAFILLVLLGGDVFLSRMGQDQVGEDSTTRLAAYALERQAIADNPWLGFGLGSFESAFRLYRDASLPLWFKHAHNDYLETLMDLGVPFGLVFFGVIGTLVSCAAAGVWNRRKDTVYPALAVGASVILGVHGLVDFDLQIPAIAASYAALLGLGVAQSFSTREGNELKKKEIVLPQPEPLTRTASILPQGPVALPPVRADYEPEPVDAEESAMPAQEEEAKPPATVPAKKRRSKKKKKTEED